MARTADRGHHTQHTRIPGPSPSWADTHSVPQCLQHPSRHPSGHPVVTEGLLHTRPWRDPGDMHHMLGVSGPVTHTANHGQTHIR